MPPKPDLSSVAPDLRPFLAAFPDLPLQTAADLPKARAFLDDLTEGWRTAPPPAGVERFDISVPGLAKAPDIRVVVHRPVGAHKGPVLLHFHGGGMIMGKPEIDNPRMGELAARHGWTVLAPDYRKAPEAPWPAAVEDGYAVLDWLASEEAQKQGLGAGPVALSGESGGGALAAALAIHARDRKNPIVQAVALSAPMLDDKTGLDEKMGDEGRYVIWTPAYNRLAWGMVLGGDADTALIPIPAGAGSLKGLPPTYIHVGALDQFVPEILAWTARLAESSVPVELHVLPGAFHGFDKSPEGAAAIDARRMMEQFLTRHLTQG